MTTRRTRAAHAAGGCFPFPTVARALTEADVDYIVRALQAEHVEKYAAPATEKLIREWGQAQLSKLGSDLAFDIRNPLVSDWLDGFREVTLQDISATTADALRDTILNGVRAGEGVTAIAQRIGGVFDAAKGYRAERIARTETGSAMNAANLAAYDISGMVSGKEWLCVGDADTRESHLALDGVVVGIKELFVSGDGHHASAPGQFGIAEEDINCRCACLPKVDGKASPAGEERVAVWRSFDSSVESKSNAIFDAFVTGFRLQESEVLAALRRAA